MIVEVGESGGAAGKGAGAARKEPADDAGAELRAGIERLEARQKELEGRKKELEAEVKRLEARRDEHWADEILSCDEFSLRMGEDAGGGAKDRGRGRKEARRE